MLKMFIPIVFLFLSGRGHAQNSCAELNNLLDSVHIHNVSLRSYVNDTPKLRKYFSEHYKHLQLNSNHIKGSSVPNLMAIDVPAELRDSMLNCLLTYAAANKLFIYRGKTADSNGFNYVSLWEGTPENGKKLLSFYSFEMAGKTYYSLALTFDL